MKAFPITSSLDKNNGMDLRDYFAAKAMEGLMSVPIAEWPTDMNGHTPMVYAAETAYQTADAMMKARDA